ncbi:MAG: WD40 repeat domain-containing protein, partial [Polyangiales bacterium]
MIRSTLRFAFTTTLLAACGNDGAGPPVDPPDAAIEPITRSPIEACIAGGGALAPQWATGNQHGAVTSLTVTGTTVVLGSEDGSVKQWAVAAAPSYGTSFDTGESGRPVTQALAVASDGTVLGADASGALGEWRLSDAKPMRTTPITTVPLIALAVDAGANHVAVGGGTDIRVVDRAAGTTSPKLVTTLWGLDALAFDATALFTAGHNYSTPQVERRDGASPIEVVDRWNDQTKQGHVRAIAVSRDGAHLFAGGDGFVAVLDAANLAAGPIAFVPAEGHSVIGLVALSGNELFATAGSEGTVQLWKVTG